MDYSQANESYITGVGSPYYQFQQTLAIGSDSTRSINEIPECTYTFLKNGDSGKYFVQNLDDDQIKVGMEQMQIHVQQIRQGGSVAQGNIDYLNDAMKTALENAKGWLSEQGSSN